MKYILKRTVSPEHLQGWDIEPCSPFEISEAVSNAAVLSRKTAQALSAFFSHTGLTGWEIENLPYRSDFPEFEPEDIVYFVFCPNSNTFQFWKGTKK